jgi:hypothetical protein
MKKDKESPFTLEQFEAYIQTTGFFKHKNLGRQREDIDRRSYIYLVYHVWFQFNSRDIHRRIQVFDDSTIRHHMYQAVGFLEDTTFLKNTRELKNLFPLPEKVVLTFRNYGKPTTKRVTVTLNQKEIELLNRVRHDQGFFKYEKAIKFLINKKG